MLAEYSTLTWPSQSSNISLLWGTICKSFSVLDKLEILGQLQVGFWNQGVIIIISFTFAHVFSTGIAFMHHTRVHVFTKLRYLACCCATSCSEQIVVGSGHSAIICLLINDTKTLCSVISIVLCSCITRWQCGKPKRMPNIK